MPKTKRAMKFGKGAKKKKKGKCLPEKNLRNGPNIWKIHFLDSHCTEDGKQVLQQFHNTLP